jgi:hypothetical protein
MVTVFFVFADLLDDPVNGGEERLVKHRSAGFADGFQTTEGPLVRMILPGPVRNLVSASRDS